MQTENAASDAPVHPMSEYEKFLFDLKGFLVIPGVLTDEETRTVREHTETLLQDPESLPEHHRAHRLPGQRNFSLIIQELWGSCRR